MISTFARDKMHYLLLIATLMAFQSVVLAEGAMSVGMWVDALVKYEKDGKTLIENVQECLKVLSMKSVPDDSPRYVPPTFNREKMSLSLVIPTGCATYVPTYVEFFTSSDGLDRISHAAAKGELLFMGRNLRPSEECKPSQVQGSSNQREVPTLCEDGVWRVK